MNFKRYENCFIEPYRFQSSKCLAEIEGLLIESLMTNIMIPFFQDSPIRNDMRVRLSTYLNASEASHPPPLPDDTRDATDGPRRPTDIIPLVPTDQPMPDVPNGGEEQHPIWSEAE